MLRFPAKSKPRAGTNSGPYTTLHTQRKRGSCGSSPGGYDRTGEDPQRGHGPMPPCRSLSLTDALSGFPPGTAWTPKSTAADTRAGLEGVGAWPWCRRSRPGGIAEYQPGALAPGAWPTAGRMSAGRSLPRRSGWPGHDRLEPGTGHDRAAPQVGGASWSNRSRLPGAHWVSVHVLPPVVRYLSEQYECDVCMCT